MAAPLRLNFGPAATLTYVDVGLIIFLVILIIIMPVGILMSFGALAGVVGHLTKTGVDADHADSELLPISEANPWAGPSDEADAEAEADS